MEEQQWMETEIEINTVNWKGEAIVVTGVKALRDSKTGCIRVYPFEVAKAEVRQMADRFKLLPRDVATLLMIYAPPGYFRKGEVFYKYHLQKELFYLNEALKSHGFEEAFPMDTFIAADNGPKPKSLDEDLQRLSERKLITIKLEKIAGRDTPTKRITLTAEGEEIADQVWNALPDPYKEFAIAAKKRIHILSPERVRHLVHNEFPECKNSYVKNDIE